MELRDFFEKNPKVALAFSGGVDSAYLLYAAKDCGAEIRAYYVKTQFQPEFEYEDACRLAKQLQAELVTIPMDILQDQTIVENPENRCYYCKQKIFTAIIEQAKSDGFSLVIDGTNASDDTGSRPGMQALQQLQVRSPLRELGLTKEEIRARSKKAGLFTHDKPAYACLATRIPTGTVITQELLSRTEKSEEFLKNLGFSDFRVRVLEDAARIQVRQQQIPLLLEKRQMILQELKKDYSAVLFDMEVRENG